jgi:hypothetical protein
VLPLQVAGNVENPHRLVHVVERRLVPSNSEHRNQ